MIYRGYIDNNALKGTNLAIAHGCLRILHVHGILKGRLTAGFKS